MRRKKIHTGVLGDTSALLWIAAQLETGKLDGAAAAKEIRAFIDEGTFSPTAAARGRPKGSRRDESLARSREYFALIDAGTPPARAAEVVAAKYQINEDTVRKNARRHEKTLVDEIHRDIDATHLRFFDAVGSQYPTEIGDIRNAINLALEETARHVEAARNVSSAAIIRYLMPAIQRELMIGLGKVLADYLPGKIPGNVSDS